MPVFIGNSIRLNPEGTLWKAVIYCVNWQGLQKTKTLDGNLLNTIEDDTCVQGTRPEYVQYQNKWWVATADYGGKNNEVRLYNPRLLSKAKKTSEKKVLYKNSVALHGFKIYTGCQIKEYWYLSKIRLKVENGDSLSWIWPNQLPQAKSVSSTLWTSIKDKMNWKGLDLLTINII